MSVQDYKINAEVRRFLVSRWVDVSRLQLGTTNGVVYVMGFLDTVVADPQRRADHAQQRSQGERALRLAMMLDKEIRRMPFVRDVVFKLDNVYKRGGRWRSIERGQEGHRDRDLDASTRGMTRRVPVPSDEVKP
jgi:hypothetical protein